LRLNRFFLSVGEIKAICSVIKSKWRHSKHEASPEDLGYVQNLSEKMEKLIVPMGNVFVKLSTRSPKDAVFENSHLKVEQYLAEELEALKKIKKIEEIDVHDELLAFTVAANKGMSVSSAQEALDLLCVSERVYTDLNKTLQVLKSNPSLDDSASSGIQVIIRKWEQIPVDMEFSKG